MPLLSFNTVLAPWISVTHNFSFQNRTGCVCLNAIENRRPVWWCLVIDMNGHLCSFSLYRACCKARPLWEQCTLVTWCLTGHRWNKLTKEKEGEMDEWRERENTVQEISCGLLLRQIGRLEVVFGYSHLIGRQQGWWIHPSSPRETVLTAVDHTSFSG